MMMIDELLLLSGNDIPFLEARMTIHQPRIHEIAYITEHRFWMGCQLLIFDKEKDFNDKDKIDLTNQSNFNIIMAMISGRDFASRQARLNFASLLTLLFPNYQFSFGRNAIQFKSVLPEEEDSNEIFEINSENFEVLQQIVKTMFLLTQNDGNGFNPSGELAKKIANQIRRGQRQRAQLAPDENNTSILSRYVSILAIGQKQDMNDFMNYTVYQLMDSFERFQLKLQYDTWLKYRIAGATGMEDPQDWFKNIRKKNNNNR